MSEPALAYLEIKDMSKGINTYTPDTEYSPGYVQDCQNMLLTNKSPVTIGGLTKFNTTAAPNTRIIKWFESYTTAAGVSSILAMLDNTGGNADGAGFYKYVLAGDTWTPVWNLLDTTTSADVATHTPFRGQLIVTNGVDPIMKWDGTTMLPVGCLAVATGESDETWVGSATDTTAGNRKQGTQSRQLAAIASMSITYGTAKDFLTGLNGGTNFAATDSFRIWVKRTVGAGAVTVRYRFGDAADTAYFQLTETWTPNGTWQERTFLRSAVATVGAPVWSSIAKFTIFLDTAAETLDFDISYMRYALSPPVGSIVEMYAQQLAVAGITADLVSLQYSGAGTIDEFPAVNIARFSGGRNAMEKTDQITAMWSYFDELIVGKVNSAWTFSGTGVNVSISALPLTIGIDGNHAIVETPWSVHYMFDNNIFGARLTSRGIVSSNISSLLVKMDSTKSKYIVALRHDNSHTVRWSFRRTDANPSTQNSTVIIYDYLLDAWVCQYTQQISYMTKGIVNGNREILISQYDGFIRRADVGTDFDGTAIASFVIYQWMQPEDNAIKGNVVRWVNLTAYLKGTADVLVECRFADEPHEFSAATWTSYGTIATSPDGDKGFVYLGVTSRWIQVRLRATALSFEVGPPILIGYAPTERRV